MPGDNVGFNGINIQVIHQFWLASSSRGKRLLLYWAGPLQSVPQPLRLTTWSSHLPAPTPLKDKTIALIDIQIARGPGLPSTHSGVCHTAGKGFGVCSAVVQSWSWGIVFIECDRGSFTNWRSGRSISVVLRDSSRKASFRATGVEPGYRCVGWFVWNV